MAIQLTPSQTSFQILILTLISRSPSGELELAQLIQVGLRSKFLTQSEHESVPSRTDTRFANHVHNVISHRGGRNCMIRRRLIDWVEKRGGESAFAITQRGREHLRRFYEKFGIDVAKNTELVDQTLVKMRQVRI